MKTLNIILIIYFLLSSHSIVGQHISLGGGIPYNASKEHTGLNLRGYYNIGEQICFGPEFTVFFPKTVTHINEEIQTSIWEINFNAHYIFEVSEKLGMYPIIGFNYTREIEDITILSTGLTDKKTHQYIGLNIGGGFHLPQPKFVPFIEHEYVVGDLSDHIITVGLFFPLGVTETEN